MKQMSLVIAALLIAGVAQADEFSRVLSTPAGHRKPVRTDVLTFLSVSPANTLPSRNRGALVTIHGDAAPVLCGACFA